MKLAEYRLECESRAYQATGNPMHAWTAYGLARQTGREVPEWVLRYFDKARLGLVFGAHDAVEERGTRKDLGPVIARAFGLVSDGRGTAFDYDTNWWTYGRKVREFLKEGDKLQIARERVAEFYGVSASTVIRNAKVYDKVFPEGADEFVIDEDDLPDFED